MSTPEIDRGHRRMDQIERMLDMLEANPAPTVPQYDLQAPFIVTGAQFFDEGDASVPRTSIATFVPNTPYVFKFHWRSSGMNDWYVNGSLVFSYPTSGDDLLHGIVFGVEALNLENPNIAFYMSDFRLGTTNGGTQVFSDDLSAAPVVGPKYAVVDDGVFVAGAPGGGCIVSGGSNIGTGMVGANPHDADLSGLSEYWVQYTWAAPATILQALQDFSSGDYHGSVGPFTSTFQVHGYNEGSLFLQGT